MLVNKYHIRLHTTLSGNIMQDMQSNEMWNINVNNNNKLCGIAHI